MGAGSADDAPGFYILADNYTHEITRMDFQHYILWSYFNGRASIGEAVERAEHHMALQPGTLLARLPQLLDVLLRTRAIFLDRR